MLQLKHKSLVIRLHPQGVGDDQISECRFEKLVPAGVSVSPFWRDCDVKQEVKFSLLGLFVDLSEGQCHANVINRVSTTDPILRDERQLSFVWKARMWSRASAT